MLIFHRDTNILEHSSWFRQNKNERKERDLEKDDDPMFFIIVCLISTYIRFRFFPRYALQPVPKILLLSD